MNRVTRERLFELLSYDQFTGLWTWKVNRGRSAKAGDTAGHINEDGYRIIRIDGRGYRAHILAYFYMTQVWPTRQVDHEDNNRDNNRWANLRLANNGENGANKGMQRNNKVGFKGVSFDAVRGKYRSTINKDKKQIHLGYFESAEQASAAYVAAAPVHHGEFARAFHSSPRVSESRL